MKLHTPSDNFDPLRVQYIVVDLFSGAGGTSTGIERAMTESGKVAVVIAAVNHDPVAIQSHAMNHRFAVHFVEDVRNIAFWQLRAIIDLNRKIYPYAKLVIWASAECTNYSRAKGGQPRDADSRTLPEALYQYVEYFAPDCLQVENVTEFLSWGPLDSSGRPISKLAGEGYTLWRDTLMGLGYRYEYRTLNAADYGAHTSRTRYFGQFVRGDQGFVWPEATHSRNPEKSKTPGLKKWVAVREVLDLWDEGKSIFGRKKPLCEKTLERIHAGLVKFVAGGDTSFLTKYFSGEPEHKNLSIDSPCGAITGRDHHAVVFMQQYHGRGIPVSIDGPATAITTKDRLSLVHPRFFSNYYSGGGQLSDINAPCPTLTSVPKQRLISPQFLVNYQYKSPATPICEPCPTLLTRDKFAVVHPQFLDQQYGQSRPSSIDHPSGALTQNPKLSLVSARWLMDTSFSNRGTSVNEPAPTLLACRKHHYLVNVPGDGSVVQIVPLDSPWTVKIKTFMMVYGICDIRMRMLKIPEMLRIMGFGDQYHLTGTQTNQKKFIGNAVHTLVPQRWFEAMAV